MGYPILYIRYRIPDIAHGISDYVYQISNIDYRIPDIVHGISDIGDGNVTSDLLGFGRFLELIDVEHFMSYCHFVLPCQTCWLLAASLS